MIRSGEWSGPLQVQRTTLSAPWCTAECAPVGSVALLQRVPQWWRCTPPRSQIRPQIFGQHLRSILCRHTVHPHGDLYSTKCCTIGISTTRSSGWNCIPGTCFELSSSASHRLDAITEDHHSCAHRSISFQTSCHLMCLITRVPSVISWSPAPTSRPSLSALSPPTMSRLCALIDLDPTSQLRTLQTTQSRCSTCWSHPHLGNSLPNIRLRQLSFFSSAAIRHDVFHHLPFDSSSPRVFWITYSCNSSNVVPRSAPLRLTSRCLHGPSHAACVWKSLTSCHQPSFLPLGV